MESSNMVDIESPCISLANSMRYQFVSLPSISSACTIYRVPDRLRLVKEGAYTPQVISLGPLHHSKDSLKAMEEHKMRYLWKYLDRTGESLESCIKIVKESEQELRYSYAETIGFSSDQFVHIILVDSIFIIKVLLRDRFSELEDEPDRIFKKPWMLHDVRLDLLMLESQLLFFILEKLYKPHKITLSSGKTMNLSIIELSHKFLTRQIPLEGTEKRFKTIKHDNFAHFVDLLRKLYIPSNQHNEGELKSLTIPSITELHHAGVKFKVASSKNLFDINSKNGILEIPKLTTSVEVEVTIRNQLAFERCHCEDNYLNDYAIIMNRLVNIAKDVDLLVKHGIVEKMQRDSTETATLINKLGDEVIVQTNHFYFHGIFEDLNLYYGTRWHKWKANLKQNYFNTPWVIVAFIVPTLLIILAIIQAVCSILQVRWR